MSAEDLMPDAAALDRLGALDDDEPVVMLNLLEFQDGNGERYAAYGRVALPQIEKRGGRVLYSGVPLWEDPAASPSGP